MNVNYGVSPIIVPQQVCLMLQDKSPLLALYIRIKAFNSIKLLSKFNLSDLAKILNMSLNHLSILTDDLAGLGLVEKYKEGRLRKIRITYPSHAGDPECLRNFINVQKNSEPELICKEINNLTKNLCKRSQNSRKKSITLINILNNYNINVLSSISENKRFTSDMYSKVQKKYTSITKVILRGPEILAFRNSVRSMFKASHSIKDICEFMKWLERNRGKKEYWWARDWNIRTVQNKIAEFKAGRFEYVEEDDGFEQL